MGKDPSRDHVRDGHDGGSIPARLFNNPIGGDHA
jgi:hypothetical protein